MAPASRQTDATHDSDSLGLENFVEPDDQGPSLDELSRAYAAILNKGVDPYSQAEQAVTAPSIEPHALVEPEAPPPGHDENCEIVPKTILEAMLFVGHPANEPLGSERIAALMRGVRPEEIDELVSELNSQYEAEGCPYSIISVDLGYQLALKPEFAALRDVFYGSVREARLSQSAIDVLAIVAYQQPITQHDIDRLRGKPTGSILAQLVRRDLLSLVRQPDKNAKPVYRTTDRFLDLFDLDQLSDLPRSQEIERDL